MVAATLCVLATWGPCEAPPPPPLSVRQFQISYERSGGLAAMPQKLTIRPGRRAAATVGPAGRRESVEFRVSAPKVKQLRAAAEAVFDGGPPSPPAGNCADCYVYTVTYRDSTISSAQSDALPHMRSLVSRLDALIALHLPFH
jgi:hypothetical protein